MKQAKPLITILIMMLICCSNSVGQSVGGIGGTVPNSTITSGAGVYPLGTVDNGAKVSIASWEFQCFLISSCGIFPLGNNVTDDAIVYLGGVGSGAIVPLDGVSRMKP